MHSCGYELFLQNVYKIVLYLKLNMVEFSLAVLLHCAGKQYIFTLVFTDADKLQCYVMKYDHQCNRDFIIIIMRPTSEY